jgi:hypothetical protein
LAAIDAQWGVCAGPDPSAGTGIDEGRGGSSLERENSMNDRQWYAGIDWGSQNHCVFLTDNDGRRIGEKIFPHSSEGLAEMAAWLLAQTGASDPAQVLAAIEVPHGPVVEALLERGFAVHAINPKQLDRFRDRFTVAGAKDDSRDAEVMSSSLRTDPHCFRTLLAVDPALVELREWSRIAEELGRERTSLANRLQSLLWRYFPSLIELEPDLAAEWLLALLELAATPQKAARLHKSTIAKLLQRHRIRRLDADAVIAVLRQPPLPVAAGTSEAASAHVATIIPRLRLLNRQIKETARRIDGLTSTLMAPQDDQPGQHEQRDAVILASLPGITSPRCWQKHPILCNAEITPLCDLSQASRPSPGGPAKARASSDASLVTTGSPTRSTIGPASPCSRIPEAMQSTHCFAVEATPTAELFEPSQTVSSTLHAPCSGPDRPFNSKLQKTH